MYIAMDSTYGREPPPWPAWKTNSLRSVKDLTNRKKSRWTSSDRGLGLMSMLTCVYAPWRTSPCTLAGDGGSRRLQARTFSVAILCVLIVILSCTCTYVSAEGSSFDGCDWTGSGAELPAESRGVQPIYLRCSQGKVTWLYPRGALRVVLRHGTAGREFQGCIKVAPEFRGALIYLEAHRHLRLLYGGQQGESSKKLHCFESRGGQAALYVEAEPNSDPLKKDVAAFQYDLAILPRDSSQWDPLEDCRPCTPEETLQEFCSADFVARGIISAIYNDEELEHTALTVRASRVIRQTSSIFVSPSRTRSRKDVSGLPAISNALTSSSVKEYSSGVLHIPLKCQAKHGSGEFIFMGRQRLGQNIVWCAPRWEEWAEFMRKAKTEGSAQCILES